MPVFFKKKEIFLIFPTFWRFGWGTNNSVSDILAMPVKNNTNHAKGAVLVCIVSYICMKVNRH